MKTILCYIAIAVIVITTLLVVPAIVPPIIMTMETIILFIYFTAVATAMLILWIYANNKGE